MPLTAVSAPKFIGFTEEVNSCVPVTITNEDRINQNMMTFAKVSVVLILSNLIFLVVVPVRKVPCMTIALVLM